MIARPGWSDRFALLRLRAETLAVTFAAGFLAGAAAIVLFGPPLP